MIHHVYTALLGLLCRQTFLQGLNKEFLLFHTDQASLQGKERQDCSNSQITADRGGEAVRRAPESRTSNLAAKGPVNPS